MTNEQRKAAASLLRAAFTQSIAILEEGAIFLAKERHKEGENLLRAVAARLRSDSARVRTNEHLHDVPPELDLFHSRQNIELVMSLVDAYDVMAQTATALYEIGAHALATRADVAAEYLHEKADFAYSEVDTEDFTGYHEGTNVESEFARLYFEFTTVAHLDPNDLPMALRHALTEGGYDWQTVEKIPDEELLADARECRARQVARGKAGQ